LLVVCRAVVDVYDDSPVALQDVAGDVSEDRQRPPGNVRAVHGALHDMPGQDALADPAIRILADPTGAEGIAGADLQQLTLELVGHGFTSFGSELLTLLKVCRSSY